ncbi:MAG: SDR family oxidoreductase [Meiothermus sp.]|nr:SDR family oxidoreductase [Meiothermus sp.]
MKLENKVCIVTGAARGIGRAVARAFAAEGAVVYGADRVAGELEAEMKALRDKGLWAVGVPTDLMNPDDIQALVDRVVADQGRVDVLANVAGVIEVKHLEETTLEDWDTILAINLRAPFLTCRAVAPVMRRQGSGSIMNVSSRAGVMGFADEIAYCASKWGLEGLSRSIALDLEPHGIAVNTITPGTPTHTSMSEKTYSEETRKVWRDPAEIAPAFVHLALQTPQGLHNRYVNAWELSQQLKEPA